jgi:hypothetical protein
MGLLRALVLAPVAPVLGVVWLAETLQQVAEQEMNDPAAWRARLAEAEDAHRRGELTDEQLAAVEELALERLVPPLTVARTTADG